MFLTGPTVIGAELSVRLNEIILGGGWERYLTIARLELIILTFAPWKPLTSGPF